MNNEFIIIEIFDKEAKNIKEVLEDVFAIFYTEQVNN